MHPLEVKRQWYMSSHLKIYLLALLDLVVAEAVKSFELNIALFDEVEQLSQKNLLTPTKVTVSKAEAEDKVEPVQIDSKSSFTWPSATSVAIGVAAIGVVAYIYQKVQRT